MCSTIIFQTAWLFASTSCLKQNLHDDHNKDNDWLFNINKICISNTNQTIQWPITFSVCRARFCSKQNTLQLIRQCIKNSIWKSSVTNKYYSNGIAYRFLSFFVLRRYITVYVFCKICRKYSSNAHWLRLVSVLAGFLFDMQISLILKIRSISV